MLLGIVLLFIFQQQLVEYQASLVGSKFLAGSRPLGSDPELWPTLDLIQYHL